ncbi:reverse transcriptase/maturase family protein [bacterium]|nr:reverse transcriptase/maturase family protein [bacterium]
MDWFRERNYRHFDYPLKEDSKIRTEGNSKEKLTDYVANPNNIYRHSFLPFISTIIETKRYKKEKCKVGKKKRPISYASHLDSHIYAYYAFLLNKNYEVFLAKNDFNKSVLAYRRFEERKCNIHFARDAFRAIKIKGECSVIALDVSGFFDNINHSLLKKFWCRVQGVEKLSADHYAIYKSITRYSHVDLDCLKNFSDILERERWESYCSSKQFREYIRGNGLVRTNINGVGIPQGSPISALLSNIYMIEFDERVYEYAKVHDITYFRYSDDILLICPPNIATYAEKYTSSLLNEYGLDLSTSKTTRSHFHVDSNNKQYADKPIQYLGFTYDGRNALIRSSTFSRFHQKMKKGVRQAANVARSAARRGEYTRIFKKK